MSEQQRMSPTDILASVMTLVETSDPFLTAAAAYRDKAKAGHGFSEPAAEELAIHFHQYLLSSLRGSGS